MNKLTKQIFWTSVIVVVALTLVNIFFVNRTEAPSQTAETQSTETENITVLIHIGNSYESKTLSLPAETTVIEALRTLDQTDPELRLEIKSYEGLGDLVGSMYGLINGTDDKYWQYEVNDTMPQVGAGDYKLEDKDQVTWKFIESTY